VSFESRDRRGILAHGRAVASFWKLETRNTSLLSFQKERQRQKENMSLTLVGVWKKGGVE
jgi:hypothetical protein